METDLEFQELVRKTGILFSTNVGQGLEEWVLALTTPTLQRTQVATQADLVAAGFIRKQALERLESERDRLLALFKANEERRLQLQSEKDALEVRLRVAEVWKKAEQEGILARNRSALIDANPYFGEDDVQREGQTAWRHGWKLREVLLDQNDRLKRLQATYQDLKAAHASGEAEYRALAAAQATMQAAFVASQADHAMEVADQQARLMATAQVHHTALALREELGRQHEQVMRYQAEIGRQRDATAQADARAAHEEARVQRLEQALRFVWQEAPHGASCAQVLVRTSDDPAAPVACSCWRSRLASGQTDIT